MINLITLKKHLDFRTLVSRLIVTVVMCLPAWGIPVLAQEAESYAVFDAESATLTFRHDAAKPEGVYALNEGLDRPQWLRLPSSIIKKVVFDASFAAARPTTCRGWFSSCSSLKTVEGLANLNTEAVTDMNSMFYYCPSLKSLELSTFNTANVKNMSSMFAYASSALTINVANFDTRNVVNMQEMFRDCEKLTDLDLSSFSTPKVENMSSMFMNDISITTIFVSDKFVTTAVTSGDGMFAACHLLRGAVVYVDSKDGVKMANYTTGYFTNSAPSAPEAYAVFDADNKTLTFKFDMKRPVGAYPLNMADEAPGWRKDIYYKVEKVVFDESFARAKPTNGFMWFDSFSSLKAIDGMEHLNTEEMSNMSMMFNGCWVPKSIDLSRFNTEKVIDMSAMFKDCNDLAVLDLSTFCTDKVVDMNNMFCHCSALTNIYVSDKFVVTALTMENAGTDMFAKCDKLRGAVMYDDEHTGKEMANFEGYLTNPNGTGIGNVDASRQGEVEYYDLSGRRLSVPQKGVGIMRTGNKTRKSVVR